MVSTDRMKRVSRRYFTVLSNAVLDAVSKQLDRVFFLNIGANDGRRFDRLSTLIDREGWSGIMVEPDPVYFSELQNNYGYNPRIALVNAAITKRAGKAPFYAARPDSSLPEWVKGMGSFTPNHLTQQEENAPGISASIERIEVACETLPSLLTGNGVTRLDVVTFDTEGHDWICLQQLADVDLRPSVVFWETVHLPLEINEIAHNFMQDRSYHVVAGGTDSMAIDMRSRGIRMARWRAAARYALGATT